MNSACIKLILLFFLTAASGLSFAAESQREVRVIRAEGVGEDIASASQNAAYNALTEIVGSFVDANLSLEKRSKIENGVRSQTKSVRTDIKEYSQGTIKRFVVEEVKKDGALVRVTVRRQII